MQGTWMFDYVLDPIPDMDTDYPAILFSGETLDAECDRSNYSALDPASDAYENIFMASWNPTAQAWQVNMDGSCPTEVIDDAHGPSIVPLPQGQFKVYSQLWADGQYQITYYTPSGGFERGAESTPKILLDDGLDTEISHDCIANIQAFVYVDGGTPHQGMFFVGSEVGEPLGTLTCTDGIEQHGIYFAELRN